jgi:hypothetical protein
MSTKLTNKEIEERLNKEAIEKIKKDKQKQFDKLIKK